MTYLPKDDMTTLATVFEYIYAFMNDDVEVVSEYVKKIGGPICDLGCATGRIMKAALDQGIRAYGVEYYPEIIKIAEEKLKPKYGELAQIIQGDYTQIELPKNLGLITSMMNTLTQVLDINDRKRLLKNCHDSLKPGGYMIASFLNVTSLDTDTTQREADSPFGKIYITLTRKSDLEKEILTWFMKLVIGEKETNYEFPTSIIPHDVFCDEVKEAGFEIESLWGDFDKSTYNNKESFLQIYVLKKEIK